MANKAHRKNSRHWESMTTQGRKLFAFWPAITHLIAITIILVIYFLINKYGLFPEWINYIYYAVKIIIAIEVLAASAQTLLMPIIAFIISGLMMGFVKMYGAEIFTMADAWQLGVIALVGLLVTIIVKL